MRHSFGTFHSDYISTSSICCENMKTLTFILRAVVNLNLTILIGYILFSTTETSGRNSILFYKLMEFSSSFDGNYEGIKRSQLQ